MFANSNYAIKVAEQFAAQQRAKELAARGSSKIVVADKSARRPPAKRGVGRNTSSCSSASCDSLGVSISSMGSGSRRGRRSVPLHRCSASKAQSSRGQTRSAAGKSMLVLPPPATSVVIDRKHHSHQQQQKQQKQPSPSPKYADVSVSGLTSASTSASASASSSSAGLWSRVTSHNRIGGGGNHSAHRAFKTAEKVDVALSKIEDAVEEQQAMQQRIGSKIEVQVKLARCRYDHSTENTIAVCCTMPVIQQLQEQYQQILRVLDGLDQLEFNLMQGYVDPKNIETAISEVVNAASAGKSESQGDAFTRTAIGNKQRMVSEEEWICMLLTSDMIPKRQQQ